MICSTLDTDSAVDRREAYQNAQRAARDESHEYAYLATFGFSEVSRGRFDETPRALELKKRLEDSSYSFTDQIKELNNHFLNDPLGKTAISALKKSIRLRHDFLPSRLALSALYESAGQYEVALYLLDEISEDFPSSADVYRTRAGVHIVKGENWSAISDIQTAITLQPEKSDSYRFAALAYRGLQMYEEQIEALLTGIKKSDSESLKTWGRIDWNELGHAYSELGQDALASAAFKKADALRK